MLGRGSIGQGSLGRTLKSESRLRGSLSREFRGCLALSKVYHIYIYRYLPGCLGGWVQGGGVLGNLAEPWGVLGKIGEYWG